jgi:hypothetical protein
MLKAWHTYPTESGGVIEVLVHSREMCVATQQGICVTAQQGVCVTIQQGKCVTAQQGVCVTAQRGMCDRTKITCDHTVGQCVTTDYV